MDLSTASLKETGSSEEIFSNLYARSVKYDGQGSYCSKKTRIIFFSIRVHFQSGGGHFYKQNQNLNLVVKKIYWRYHIQIWQNQR